MTRFLITAAITLAIPLELNRSELIRVCPDLKLLEEDRLAKLANYEPLGDVYVTMYHPVPEQTTPDPDVVADGTRFDTAKASDLRWIALSRDLHARWGGPLAFNDIVALDIPGRDVELFRVKDVMNQRFTMRVDILETPGTPIYSYPRATLYKLNPEMATLDSLWTMYLNGEYQFKNYH